MQLMFEMGLVVRDEGDIVSSVYLLKIHNKCEDSECLAFIEC
jgi:hypothetical protein